MSYAWQRSEDGTGRELTASPRHLVKLAFLHPFNHERFSVGVEVQHQSAVRTLGGHEAPGFTLANLTLLAPRLRAGFDVSASIYNLLDTTRGFPGAEDHAQDVLPQRGRQFRLKVTARF